MEPQETEKKKGGYVYLIHVPSTGKSKIGMTTNMNSRADKYRVHNPDAQMITFQQVPDILLAERVIRDAGRKAGLKNLDNHIDWFEGIYPLDTFMDALRGAEELSITQEEIIDEILKGEMEDMNWTVKEDTKMPRNVTVQQCSSMPANHHPMLMQRVMKLRATRLDLLLLLGYVNCEIVEKANKGNKELSEQFRASGARVRWMKCPCGSGKPHMFCCMPHGLKNRCNRPYEAKGKYIPLDIPCFCRSGKELAQCCWDKYKDYVYSREYCTWVLQLHKGWTVYDVYTCFDRRRSTSSAVTKHPHTLLIIKYVEEIKVSTIHQEAIRTRHIRLLTKKKPDRILLAEKLEEHGGVPTFIPRQDDDPWVVMAKRVMDREKERNSLG